jgi:hypothetical protein
MVTAFLIANAISLAVNLTIWIYGGDRPNGIVAVLNAIAIGALVLT